MMIDSTKILDFLDRLEKGGVSVTARELTTVLRAQIAAGAWDAES